MVYGLWVLLKISLNIQAVLIKLDFFCVFYHFFVQSMIFIANLLFSLLSSTIFGIPSLILFFFAILCLGKMVSFDVCSVDSRSISYCSSVVFITSVALHLLCTLTLFLSLFSLSVWVTRYLATISVESSLWSSVLISSFL